MRPLAHRLRRTSARTAAPFEHSQPTPRALYPSAFRIKSLPERKKAAIFAPRNRRSIRSGNRWRLSRNVPEAPRRRIRTSDVRPCPPPTGCSAVRLAHLLWEQGVTGSNPVTPTKSKRAFSCTFFRFRPRVNRIVSCRNSGSLNPRAAASLPAKARLPPVNWAPAEPAGRSLRPAEARNS